MIQTYLTRVTQTKYLPALLSSLSLMGQAYGQTARPSPILASTPIKPGVTPVGTIVLGMVPVRTNRVARLQNLGTRR